MIGVCSPDLRGAGSGSLALIPAAQSGWLLDGLRPGPGPHGWEWLKRGLQSRKLVCPPGLHIVNEREEEHSPVVPSSTDPVVVAVAPHKASWTAAVIDAALQPLDVVRVEVSAAGYRQLRRFAQR